MYCFTTICVPVQRCSTWVVSRTSRMHLDWARFFVSCINLKSTKSMWNNIYLTRKLHIVGITVILLNTMLLSIIAFMWTHIESQDEMISTLNLKISAMEQSRMNEKDVVRAMCWKELFERIDNAQKE